MLAEVTSYTKFNIRFNEWEGNKEGFRIFLGPWCWLSPQQSNKTKNTILVILSKSSLVCRLILSSIEDDFTFKKACKFHF